MGMLKALSSVFATGIDINENNEEIIMINPALIETWKKIESGKLKKEVEKGTNNNSNGGNSFKKGYKAKENSKNTNNKTSRSLEEMTNILEGKERE